MDRKYPIPPCESLFMVTPNQFINNNAKMSEISEWLFDYSCVPLDHYMTKISPTIIVFTAYFFPYTKSVDRYEKLVKWSGCLWVLDDINDRAPEGNLDSGRVAHLLPIIKQYIQAIEHMEKEHLSVAHREGQPLIEMSTWKPCVLCMYGVAEEIMVDMNETQKRRFIRSLRECMAALHRENQMVDQLVIPDFPTFTQVRMSVGGADNLYPLVEFAEGLSVPDRDWDDPRVHKLRELCNKSAVFMNDVYSFEKELHHQSGRIERLAMNSVAYYVVREGLTVPAAMQKVVNLNREIEMEFQAVSDDVCNDPGIIDDTKVFVRAITAMIPGNIKFSQIVPRYNKIY